jgi:ubiquinone/menaquinone biosynthesis C-methylase UbiE
MALEIARLLPPRASVLDVGCGSGFIAHHLAAMLGSVIGVDLGAATEAPIEYRQFDGNHLPVADGAVDSAILCYVLHHAENVEALLSELRRVLSNGGLVVIYEDIPRTRWDRLVCLTHDRKWRARTGPCTFRSAGEWRRVFNAAGFKVLGERQLSRWRNLAHPVSRRLFLLAEGS